MNDFYATIYLAQQRIRAAHTAAERARLAAQSRRSPKRFPSLWVFAHPSVFASSVPTLTIRPSVIGR